MKNFINVILRFINGLKRPSKQTNMRLLRERGEALSSFTIRETTEKDIPALAALHVKTWNETYWNVKKPPAFEIREWQWREQFKKNDGSWFCFVVEDNSAQLVGFAKGVAYSSTDLPEYSGELNKIYLLKNYQHLGLGRKLIGDVARRFLEKGINTMVLFGVPKNPSCSFHEAMGGEKLYAKNGEFHGGYGWKDLRKLASVCAGD